MNMWGPCPPRTAHSRFSSPGDGCAFHPLPLDHEQEDRFSHMSQSELGTYRAAAPQNVEDG